MTNNAKIQYIDIVFIQNPNEKELELIESGIESDMLEYLKQWDYVDNDGEIRDKPLYGREDDVYIEAKYDKYFKVASEVYILSYNSSLGYMGLEKVVFTIDGEIQENMPIGDFDSYLLYLDDREWNLYRVWLTSISWDYVVARDERDAIDVAIEYNYDKGHKGLFYDPENDDDMEEIQDMEENDYIDHFYYDEDYNVYLTEEAMPIVENVEVKQ